MNQDEEKERPKIGMLLDIASLYGEHQGRLAPWMYVLCIGLGPALIYAYYSLWFVIPIWVFLPLDLLLIIRLIMIFPGRERHRVKIYKRQLNDEYAETASLLNIKMIHPDGCIEYINGWVMYLVACYNGTIDNEEVHSVQLRKLLESLTHSYEYDIYIHNIIESAALRDYYNKVNKFDHNTSARNFIKMIDHNIDLTQATSLVQCTVFAIRCRKSQWKRLKHQIDAAINSRVSRCYKTIYRVTDSDEINEIFNRNCDSVINIDALMRRKYATEDYATSKVLAYDLPEDQVIIQGRGAENPVLPEQTKNTFHIKYKEEEPHVTDETLS